MLSIGEPHRQDTSPYLPQTIVPLLRICTVGHIFQYDTVRVSESVLGEIEGDPMLFPITQVFFSIPFKFCAWSRSHTKTIPQIWPICNTYILLVYLNLIWDALNILLFGVRGCGMVGKKKANAHFQTAHDESYNKK